MFYNIKGFLPRFLHNISKGLKWETGVSLLDTYERPKLTCKGLNIRSS